MPQVANSNRGFVVMAFTLQDIDQTQQKLHTVVVNESRLMFSRNSRALAARLPLG
jgi:hypothetical protein